MLTPVVDGKSMPISLHKSLAEVGPFRRGQQPGHRLESEVLQKLAAVVLLALSRFFRNNYVHASSVGGRRCSIFLPFLPPLPSEIASELVTCENSLSMTSLSFPQKQEVLDLFRRGRPLAEIRAQYRISLATSYRMRTFARNGVSPLKRPFDLPGWRRAMSPVQRANLGKAIGKADTELERSWRARRSHLKGNLKSAKPSLSTEDVRKIAQHLGISCSDSTLRRILKTTQVLTAGQRLHRRQMRLRKARHM